MLKPILGILWDFTHAHVDFLPPPCRLRFCLAPSVLPFSPFYTNASSSIDAISHPQLSISGLHSGIVPKRVCGTFRKRNIPAKDGILGSLNNILVCFRFFKIDSLSDFPIFDVAGMERELGNFIYYFLIINGMFFSLEIDLNIFQI